MPRDVNVFNTFFPQTGDSFHQTLKRLLARSVRPSEDAVIYLASAARLGTTAGAVIDTRGYKGIQITNQVTAVAGVGTMQILLVTTSNILLTASNTQQVFSSAFVATSQSVLMHPGITPAPAGANVTNVGGMLSRYTVIFLINSSAVAGNEVTSECSYTLIN